MNYVSDLLYWVKEREKVRSLKESGAPFPWTTDQIIANNRWCNVRREDDKVTRWIFANFLPPIPHDAEPIALCVARLVNWPDTLQDLGYPDYGWTIPYRNKFLRVFEERGNAGKKKWTGAYMVTGGFSKGGETKEVIIARVLDGAADRCEEFIHTKPTTLQSAAEILSTPGMGSFLVAQVIADLKNTEWLNKATDRWTWCAPGPGSTIGLNFIFGRPRQQLTTNKRFIEEVNAIRHILNVEAGIRLCAQNTQNVLCEFHKYVRAKHFGERLKNSYTPE